MHSTEYGRNGNRFFAGQSIRVQDHERHGTFCADRVITVSNQLKQEIKWLYEVPDHKVKMVYNGVNSQAFDYSVDAGNVKGRYAIGPLDPTVLFVGRMVVQKGPDILVRTMPAVLKYYPNAKYVFVGDGHMKNEVCAVAHQLGVAHALRMLGEARAAICTTCSRLATSWRCQAAMNHSASSSWKAGAPSSLLSAPGAVGRLSLYGTASTVCRWTTPSIPWPGGWAPCWPTTMLPLDGPQRACRSGRRV